MSKRRDVTMRLAALLACGALLVTGCATTGPERAAQSAESMQATRGEFEKALEQLDAVVAALDDLVTNPEADLKPQYQAYATALDALDARVVSIRKRADEMAARGEAYFEGWEADAEGIANPELKEHSAQRKEKLREEYNKITTQADAVRNVANPLLQALRDLQKVIGMDLTSDGVKAVAGPAEKAKEQTESVKVEVNKLLAELETVAKLLSPGAAASDAG
jgi:hypothetical protein